MLTDAEQAVVDCLLENPTYTNAQIALVLGKSKKTVEVQLGAIYHKLDISGRVELILKFQKG